MDFDLFPHPAEDGKNVSDPQRPLADRMRPRRLQEVVGQEGLLAQGRFLSRVVEGSQLPSILFWGPPGTGKTTLAAVLAGSLQADFVSLSAVSAGVKDIKEVVARAGTVWKLRRRRTVLFIDEIHRFNKAQQDALLPHVERGTVTLIGATTENPSFEVNAALLSRVRVLTLEPLKEKSLSLLVDRALIDVDRGLGSRRQSIEAGARGVLISASDGDARRLLNVLDLASGMTAPGGAITAESIKEALQSKILRYDKSGEEHFNVISALHKSIRDSDPDGGLYWLARLLHGGEDRLYVARRLVRIAAEDVGLADPLALSLCTAAKDAVHFLGIPEGDLALAEAVVYLALAPKSNALYKALSSAMEDAEKFGSLGVPLHLRNAVTGLMTQLGYGRGYQYAHDRPQGVTGQAHFPEEMGERSYYAPESRGFEAELRRRLERLAELKEARLKEKEAGDESPASS